MARHSVARALALLSSVFALAVATLSFDEEGGSTDPRRTVVLPSFGDASVTVTVFNPFGDLTVEADDTFVLVSEPIVSGTNYTYEFSFTGNVGVTQYSMSAGDNTLEGTFVIAGFVILDDGKVVSGEDRDGVSVGQEGSFEYEVKAVGTDGNDVDLSGTNIDPRPDSGVYMEEVNQGNTGFSDGKFTLAINKLRVGTGRFIISFEASNIEHRGETFETVLHVRQSTDPVPPCVVEGSSLVSKGGVVEVIMYNILTPPRGSPVSEIVLKIGDTSTSFSSSSSSLKLPTSTVVFEGVSGVGPAEITCDGEAAVVVPTADDDGDDLTVVSGGASEPLAKDELVTEYPSSDTEARITSTIRVVNSSPDVLTVSEANAIITEYCRVAECQEIGVRSILEGSALLDIGALVEDADVAKADLRKSFDDCEFQEKTDYACDELELLEVRSTNAIAATVATAGIATWTIILISVVGAIGLVAVLTLAAWAVHRRHASRESESSYSSSGPLGVPDPSDLLYEQSIVRDVYGRGEDGGPSEQAAVDSERAAAMREEFPKPPSSSSLSRGNRSSDASSTYSV